jgi:hypothetical protein
VNVAPVSAVTSAGVTNVQGSMSVGTPTGPDAASVGVGATVGVGAGVVVELPHAARASAVRKGRIRIARVRVARTGSFMSTSEDEGQ